MRTVTVEVPEGQTHGKNRERRKYAIYPKSYGGGVNLSLKVRHSSPVT